MTNFNEYIEEISKRIFGTSDYQASLDVLAPYDALVKEFKKEIEVKSHSKNKI